MHCTCCGHTRPRKGAKLIGGTYACAECVPELQPSAPKRGQRSPEGRPKAESKEAWRPYAVDPALTAPAQPAEAPSVVRLMPAWDLRYGVDPSAPVVGGFASMGIGRYLPEGEVA